MGDQWQPEDCDEQTCITFDSPRLARVKQAAACVSSTTRGGVVVEVLPAHAHARPQVVLCTYPHAHHLTAPTTLPPYRTTPASHC